MLYPICSFIRFAYYANRTSDLHITQIWCLISKSDIRFAYNANRTSDMLITNLFDIWPYKLVFSCSTVSKPLKLNVKPEFYIGIIWKKNLTNNFEIFSASVKHVKGWLKMACYWANNCNKLVYFIPRFISINGTIIIKQS